MIACRITFPFDTFTSALEPSFGVLQIWANDNKGVQMPNPLTIASNPMAVIETSNNPNWFVSTVGHDLTMISSSDSTLPAQDQSSSFLGI